MTHPCPRPNQLRVPDGSPVQLPGMGAVVVRALREGPVGCRALCRVHCALKWLFASSTANVLEEEPEEDLVHANLGVANRLKAKAWAVPELRTLLCVCSCGGRGGRQGSQLRRAQPGSMCSAPSIVIGRRCQESGARSFSLGPTAPELMGHGAHPSNLADKDAEVWRGRHLLERPEGPCC